jgi:hypothetical protein
MKICVVGAELFHADRWTDIHDEDNNRFSQFCEYVWNADISNEQQLMCLVSLFMYLTSYRWWQKHSSPFHIHHVALYGEIILSDYCILFPQ